MNINGLNNGSISKADRSDRSNRADRPDRPDRTGASQRSDRSSEIVRPEGGNDAIDSKGGDQVETSVAGFIQNVVDQAIIDLADRLNSVTSRRDELLAKADDPEAIRRAARGFLEGESSEVTKL